MASASVSPLLEARDLVKRFPGVLALDGVRLTLGRGEVLAVIGENGAGKSTLMKILAGVQTSDHGEIILEGQPVRIDSVRAAEHLGIALIHQELNLSDNLDVGANIFLGREPRRFSLIDRATIFREAQGYLARVGLECSPRTIVGHLSVGKQQMVEIAKALSMNARILIMDEPTSSLSQRETTHLFRVIRELREKGVSVIYISHRLGEVRALADRVTVLRDGKNSGDLQKEQISHENMVRLMVGRELSQLFSRHSRVPGEVILEARDLRTTAHPGHSVSFAIRRGEIVGLAGLVGAGRTELIETLFGARPGAGGGLLVKNRTVRFSRPLDAIREGIAMIPEDRKQQGLILEMTVRENLSLPGLRRHRKAGILVFGISSPANFEYDQRALNRSEEISSVNPSFTMDMATATSAPLLRSFNC